jgi:hypothetical protein
LIGTDNTEHHNPYTSSFGPDPSQISSDQANTPYQFFNGSDHQPSQTSNISNQPGVDPFYTIQKQSNQVNAELNDVSQTMSYVSQADYYNNVRGVNDPNFYPLGNSEEIGLHSNHRARTNQAYLQVTEWQRQTQSILREYLIILPKTINFAISSSTRHSFQYIFRRIFGYKVSRFTMFFILGQLNRIVISTTKRFFP